MDSEFLCFRLSDRHTDKQPVTLLYLICFCSGINLSVGQDTPTTTCKIATDVKSALYILEVEFDPFELDDAGKISLNFATVLLKVL